MNRNSKLNKEMYDVTRWILYNIAHGINFARIIVAVTVSEMTYLVYPQIISTGFVKSFFVILGL